MSKASDFLIKPSPARTAMFFVIAFVVFEAFLVVGLVTEHFWETLSNGAMICLSCIGVG
ncbi:MAG: hypothetical protein KAW67_04830 [Candidatus Eisenbacteria sp.]|nr:hypothetical protein [Candidatus Eisenbacteria bacterium]